MANMVTDVQGRRHQLNLRFGAKKSKCRCLFGSPQIKGQRRLQPQQHHRQRRLMPFACVSWECNKTERTPVGGGSAKRDVAPTTTVHALRCIVSHGRVDHDNNTKPDIYVMQEV